MGFPTNIEVLKNSIATRRNAARTASDEASHRERENQENQAIAEILNRLLSSWRDSDPGKYGDAFFFLDATLRKRVVVQEFLADGTKVYQTRQEWGEYDRTRSWEDAKYDGVPYWYSVVTLSDVGRGECLKCKSLQPVVEHYVQAYDSPEGDVWLKKHLVLCLDCNLTTTLESKTSDSRF
ncbi:MAG: hypothetical protein A3C80_02015 [Candidatus Ryanbacteria bacterium RIFCSPHIGHO2_02_FULL_45_43]|uniref:Uncharacterized protein n=1 Tax=Candidatus Ryanbacteria bacterium RIFCSPHIGHO2_01_45_13 TaxID=1802112 RepID=A0A1G2FY69_9BACT|nr:MAG: hypothetical protein A2718_02845 [Candidatus Ryanbacteria bacterium RIFCSPHIGHO2_01_FULL_44_130]OGZ43016.1 MAG: hypothetical protein A2W41_02790 [Candidatus Ryanbacteria bacterium RIFCSPHIGHO2_01_45_13]OGZ48721.1 MAG: hypothetical protein A3C80_02015 [Candidatus Ryanbacteria bacterium RIFCSPHIGHO2_02_FULL_45_43]OGZ50661.1 MAG: hypothetical protein A3E55_03495 [Candidatus Ryanbacteria bacterium RIFCSPHIGHO2_12_FULL_44_20]OGZ51967.1 MAG: hypothetical protein A3A17_00870 [Candidatus Ryanba